MKEIGDKIVCYDIEYSQSIITTKGVISDLAFCTMVGVDEHSAKHTAAEDNSRSYNKPCIISNEFVSVTLCELITKGTYVLLEHSDGTTYATKPTASNIVRMVQNNTIDNGVIREPLRMVRSAKDLIPKPSDIPLVDSFITKFDYGSLYITDDLYGMVYIGESSGMHCFIQFHNSKLLSRVDYTPRSYLFFNHSRSDHRIDQNTVDEITDIMSDLRKTIGYKPYLMQLRTPTHRPNVLALECIGYIHGDWRVVSVNSIVRKRKLKVIETIDGFLTKDKIDDIIMLHEYPPIEYSSKCLGEYYLDLERYPELECIAKYLTV